MTDKATQTTETVCLRCGARLVWTAEFCRTAPDGFNYFDCGRHQAQKQTERASR